MWWDRRQSLRGRLLTVPTMAVPCVPPVTAGCVAEDSRKHQTPLPGPAADTGEEGRHIPEPKPSCAPHLMCLIAAGQLEPKAFVWIYLSTLDSNGTSNMKCATSPALGTREETPRSLTESLAATYQPLGEKLLLAKASHFFLRNRISSRCFPAFSYLSQQAIGLCQNKQDIK